MGDGTEALGPSARVAKSPRLGLGKGKGIQVNKVLAQKLPSN